MFCFQPKCKIVIEMCDGMMVKIDKLSHDFRGICRVNDKVTFVSNALPNEVVDIRIVNEKKSYNEGKVISYVEKSNDRIVNKCVYSDRCGGCDIGYICYDKQVLYKKEMVTDIFKKYADIIINPNIVSCDNINGYRNKITFKVKDGKLCLVDEDNGLVGVDRCLLVNDKINSVIKMFSYVDLFYVNEVIIRGDSEIMVIINGDVNYEEVISVLGDMVNSIVVNNKVIYGSDYINISVDKYKYAIYPNSFFQVNTFMISKLYDKVKEYAGHGNNLLDLYCGAGTIGIYLADNFDLVCGIEVNRDAVRSANLNKEINNISNISFLCKKANEIVISGYDVVVVDPPRGGLDDNTINSLLDSDVNRIVYVSCNPITLARDVNVLKSKYKLKDITLFDNFPNTKHVESVCLLERIQ